MYNLFYLFSIAAVIIGIQFGTRYFRARRLCHWLKIGMDAYGTQRYEDALPAFRKCVRIAPEWVHTRALTWALITLFYVLCMPDAHDTLLNALDTLYKIDPESAARLIEKPQFRNLERLDRYRALKDQILAWDANHT